MNTSNSSSLKEDFKSETWADRQKMVQVQDVIMRFRACLG